MNAATGTPLSLGPELTIVFAAAMQQTLSDAVQAGEGPLVLDLGEVSDFDSAGVQLLLATRRSLADRGRTLHVAAASSAVTDALVVFGLQSLLMPAAAPERTTT
jgi:anti-sigma B factor antagonist